MCSFIHKWIRTALPYPTAVFAFTWFAFEIYKTRCSVPQRFAHWKYTTCSREKKRYLFCTLVSFFEIFHSVFFFGDILELWWNHSGAHDISTKKISARGKYNIKYKIICMVPYNIEHTYKSISDIWNFKAKQQQYQKRNAIIYRVNEVSNKW